MPGGKRHDDNARGRTSRRRNEVLLRSVEEISTRHGGRLRRWLTTWDAVDCSLLNRMILQAKEAREACQLLPSSLPLLDEIQTTTELEIASAIDRIEHLVVICQQAGTRNNPSDDDD